MKTPRDGPEANHRIQFHFTEQQIRRLDEIREHLELPSYVQVVRQLIAEYHNTHINKRKPS